MSDTPLCMTHILGARITILARDLCEVGVSYRETLNLTKRAYVLQLLHACKFNQSHAAKKMGLHRNSFRRIVREIGIDVRLVKRSAR